MSNYLPTDSRILRTDTKIGCDLYLLVKTNTDSRYILYYRGDTVFENNKSEILLEDYSTMRTMTDPVILMGLKTMKTSAVARLPA